MARAHRPQVAGGIYHITARGNRRQPIYVSDPDNELFLSLLARVAGRLGWLCHAYCLMPNHLHLVLTTPQPNLSRGMQWLCGTYAHVFNEIHGFNGHLFQGRFHSVLVERTEHVVELARYVPLNPVRARLCAHPSDWRWSSYRATAGIDPVPRELAAGWLLSQFGGDVPKARRAFVAFVAEGGPDTLSPLRRAA